jgi:4-hydroxy 2-oxovalerate aldolase
VIGEHIMPLQKTMAWGYHIPYMVSGVLNIHPQQSLEFMEAEKGEERSTDFRSFYDQVISD